jgi:hypothetical protein
MESQFAKAISELDNSYDFAEWQVTEQKSVTELQQALKAIEQRLVEFKQKHRGATLLVLQTTLGNLAQLGVHSLATEFPIIRCPTVFGDNEYPALDWLRFAIGNMTRRFTEVPLWLQDKLNFARYTVIPLCNLENDTHSSVIDLLYARSLYTHKHLLWYSDS